MISLKVGCKKKLTKAELLDCLKEKGVVTKGRVADLIIAAQNNGIPDEEGVVVDRTPKCHCKIAGEGIEYSWGLAKINTARFFWRIKEVRKNSNKVLENEFHEH